MTAKLSFIIPVRHQDNAADWSLLKRNLAATIRSIAAQDDDRWEAVIVANEGADLPTLPRGFSVERVTFPPNPLHDMGSADLESVYEAVRFDKGRRILAGLLSLQPRGHVMIVDDDDFVSRRLTAFVAKHPAANGWFVNDGYVWGDGGNLVYRHHEFSHFCGTSHIVRADLYEMPANLESASKEYICRMLGSHRFIEPCLNKSGTPLAPLPFYGAVYRVGHAGSHSKSGGLLRQIFDRSLLRRPRQFIRRAVSVRPLTPAIRQEFFGHQAGGV